MGCLSNSRPFGHNRKNWHHSICYHVITMGYWLLPNLRMTFSNWIFFHTFKLKNTLKPKKKMQLFHFQHIVQTTKTMQQTKTQTKCNRRLYKMFSATVSSRFKSQTESSDFGALQLKLKRKKKTRFPIQFFWIRSTFSERARNSINCSEEPNILFCACLWINKRKQLTEPERRTHKHIMCVVHSFNGKRAQKSVSFWCECERRRVEIKLDKTGKSGKI